jgi:protein SCO1/2
MKTGLSADRGGGPGISGSVALAAFLMAIAGLAGCAPSKKLDVFGQVSPFQLTDQTGRQFESRALEGHVWVADFFFTTCKGPCPMMSYRLHVVQTKTADLPDVKLVSFTVDPAHDTPKVLAAYSKNFSAEAGRWWFLTGAQGKLNELGLGAFHLNNVDGSLNHSTRFALVDRRMRIRGYYSVFEKDGMKNLLDDIRRLERERP